MNSSLRVLLVIQAACAALACTPRESNPEGVYRAFASAVAERDGDRAWALLSADTKAWLDARARELSLASPGVIAASGQRLVLGPASSAVPPLVSVRVVKESGGLAVVEAVDSGGAKSRVELVREKGWRVRIPAPAVKQGPVGIRSDE